MQPGADLPGEEEGPADPDRAERVELVGVEEQLRLAAHRAGRPPVAVAAHAVRDPADAARVGAVAQQDLAGHRRAGRGVAGRAGAVVLLRPADVVQQRREREHPLVGAALGAEPQREREHPLDVVEAVAAAPGGHQPPRLAAHGAHERVAEQARAGRALRAACHGPCGALHRFLPRGL